MRSACHAYTNDALGKDDAIALAQKLKNNAVSPKELAEAAIQRAESVGHILNAVEDACYESDQLDRYKPGQIFSGIPSFIKDNVPVKGFNTRFGCKAIPPRKARFNDPYAKQFLNLGFNVLGKSSLPEFGLNATTEPSYRKPTPNPWNRQHSAGASSGGAAALVAAGVVPIAHGNDGGGSIRIPAACCGLVGLKPSRGRHVNSHAARALPINIVSEGVLTRSVRDTAYFHYEAQTHYQNKRLHPIPLITTSSDNIFTVGVLKHSVTGTETDDETLSALEETKRLLSSLGHKIVEIDYPTQASFSDDFAHYWSMLAFLVKKTGTLAFGKQFNAEDLEGLTQGLAQHFRDRLFETPLTLFRLKQHGQHILKTFNDVDLVLSPVTSHTTPKLGHLSPSVPYEELFERLRNYVGFTPLANVSGAPAISLPISRTKNKLPISMQFMANLGREDLLLDIAYAIETHRPWSFPFDKK